MLIHQISVRKILYILVIYKYNCIVPRFSSMSWKMLYQRQYVYLYMKQVLVSN